MIGFLRGNVAAIFDDRIILDVGGVGFNVLMTSRHISQLSVDDSDVVVYTHMSVREDAMTLYGFLTSEDVSFFKMLIGVSGVGPKFALGLLSTFNVSDLRFAILSMDAKTISKSPGIGLKSAQKIILELKDKVSMDDVINSFEVNTSGGNVAPLNEAMAEAAEALQALGYSATDSMRAIRECGADDTDTVETILKKSLRKIKG